MTSSYCGAVWCAMRNHITILVSGILGMMSTGIAKQFGSDKELVVCMNRWKVSAKQSGHSIDYDIVLFILEVPLPKSLRTKSHRKTLSRHGTTIHRILIHFSLLMTHLSFPSLIAYLSIFPYLSYIQFLDLALLNRLSKMHLPPTSSLEDVSQNLLSVGTQWTILLMKWRKG